MRLLPLLRRAVAVAGLAVDAYIHFTLAHRYDPVAANISQGTLFRIEGAAAAGLAVQMTPPDCTSGMTNGRHHKKSSSTP